MFLRFGFVVCVALVITRADTGIINFITLILIVLFVLSESVLYISRAGLHDGDTLFSFEARVPLVHNESAWE